MGRMMTIQLGAAFIAAMVTFQACAAEMPTAPRTMPAPSPVKGGGQPAQTVPGQPQQPQKQKYSRHQPKLRQGNTPESSKSDGKKADESIEISGSIALATTSPGEPEAYSVTGADGKGYTLKGRESTLKKLVGKNVDIEGELDEKDGKTVLKVKSVREAKEGKDEKKSAKNG